MLEHVSGLYIKVWLIQYKLWELREKSISFTKNIEMKKVLMTK